MSAYPPFRTNSQKRLLLIANVLHSTQAPLTAPAPVESPIKVVCVSDTHNKTPQLPDGDVLSHAGDLAGHGIFAELQAQLDWLKQQPRLFKVVIAGNHDRILDASHVTPATVTRKTPPDSRCAEDLDWGSMIYLENSSTSLELPGGRKLSIYGCPLTPQFGPWAFQYPVKDEVWRQRIPGGTDVLLTHGPPYAHLDRNDYGGRMGCPHHLRELERARPRLIVCGHIHEDGGKEEWLAFDGIERNWERMLKKEKGWMVLWGMVAAWAWGWLRWVTRLPVNSRTKVVNAAVSVRGQPGGLGFATVVWI